MRASILLVAGLNFLLCGCVSVNTTVFKNGEVIKQVRIEVDKPHREAVWKEVQGNLIRSGPGWSAEMCSKRGKTLITATQFLSDANVDKRYSLSVERQGWTHRQYRYSEHIPLGVYVSSPEAKSTGATIPVSLSLKMPGRITEASGADIQGNRATWQFNLGAGDITLQATSVRSQWCMAIWTVVIILMILAGIVAWIREGLGLRQ